jgi:MSHA biogenesis protein MshL
MMFVHVIQRASVACAALAACVGAQASQTQQGDEAPELYAAASRMSTSLSTTTVAARSALAKSNVSTAGIDGEQRFDFVVNNAPASQVFLQLGSGTRYNILVPPELAGRISLNLKSTTVPEALEVMRELFGFEFRINGNRVFVSSNAVQTRLFRINYLPGRRVGSSELSIASPSTASSGGSGSSSGSGTSGSNGSTSGSSGSSGSGGGASMSTTSSVQTSTDTDFWRDVRTSLESLIGNEGGRNVTINGAAGVIVVRATPAELRQVTEYLRAVQVTIERQVMLEAKIVEVELSKGSETGINWGLFRTGSNGGQVGLIGMAPGVSLTSSASNANVAVTPGTGIITQAAGKGFYGLAVNAPNFSALLSFLETQGDVQVLSSPRIAALNNQKAVLKVGSDDTFITSVTNNVTVVNNQQINNPTVTTRTYFSGISLDVTPQIDDNGTVMLHVHPAISVAAKKSMTITLDEKVTELPGVALSINETDSVVRVRDGQIVALGGLMQQTGNNNESGVPGLSRAPVVGNLFKYKTKSSTKRELVILIKPTVLNDDGSGADATAPVVGLLDQRKE